MRIPPYWSKEAYTGVDRKGRERMYAVWGWSFESIEAAGAEAAAKARRLFDNLDAPTHRDSYDYLERPLREEIYETLSHNEQQIALITRNRYGALVLNTASVCFVDIDFPPPRARGFLDALKMLFNPQRRQQRAEEQQNNTVDNVLQWAANNPSRQFRLYQTAAGLRLLFTDRLYDPTSEEVAQLLDVLGSDVLYRRLTTRQECFRARLTPKPWRCGCLRPPNRYPWATEEEEQVYRTWEAGYQKKSDAYGVCRLVTSIGDAPDNGHITAVIEIHDQYTCLDPALPIA